MSPALHSRGTSAGVEEEGARTVILTCISLIAKYVEHLGGGAYLQFVCLL